MLQNQITIIHKVQVSEVHRKQLLEKISELPVFAKTEKQKQIYNKCCLVIKMDTCLYLIDISVRCLTT